MLGTMGPQPPSQEGADKVKLLPAMRPKSLLYRPPLKGLLHEPCADRWQSD